MKQINSDQIMLNLEAGLSCSGAILGGFFGGMLTGGEAGAAISAPFAVAGPHVFVAGVVLGGTVGSIAGALAGAATSCK